MKQAKIGAIFLMSLIALAGVGSGYAWWTEDLVIDGEVELGTFGWYLTLWSDYTIGDDKLIVVHYAWREDNVPDPNQYYDTIKFYARNMYPCVTYVLDWDMHFWGTVPGHIDDIVVITTIDGSPVVGLPDYLDLYVYHWSSNLLDYNGNSLPPPVDADGYMSFGAFIQWLLASQWHENGYIDVDFNFHFVEEGMDYWDGTPVPDGVEPPQGTSFGLTITFKGVQYNYIPPAGG
jgi:hypothetical protein